MRKFLLLLLCIMAMNVYGVRPREVAVRTLRGASPVAGDVVAAGSLPERFALPGAEKGYGVAFNLGYVQFDIATPRNRTTLFPFTTPMVIAGTMMPDGNLLAFTYTEGSGGSIKMEKMIRINSTDGAVTELVTLPEDFPTLLDATYEPVSGSLLALAVFSGNPRPSLVKIDQTTAFVTQLRYLDDIWYSLAADGSGRVFFVTQDTGEVGMTDAPLSGKEPISVGRGTAAGAAYISSLAMDKDAYMLYWAMCASDGRCYLVALNPVSGASTSIGTIGTAGASKEIMALNIPDSKPQSGTPQAPTGLNVIPDATGALTGKATWVNPSADSVMLYLNGEEVYRASITAQSTVGEYNLTTLRQGYNHVRVAAKNAVGEGEYADTYFWAGKDVPRAVRNLKLQRLSPDSAVLTWDAPDASVHGGYVSPSNIKYRITRYAVGGDTVVVQKTYRRTEYREKINNSGTYYYTVQALSTDYGQTAATPSLYLGAAMSVPYVCDFSSQAQYSLWTKHTNAGNSKCWTYYTTSPAHVYNPPVQPRNDDWFFSAPVSLEAGKQYYVYMQVKSGLGEYYPKMFEITCGQQPTAAAQTMLQRDTIASRVVEEVRATIAAQTTGEYTVGIHDYSPYVGCNLYIYRFEVREKNAGSISGQVTDESGNAVAGAEVAVNGTTLSALTDAQGRYMVDYITPGTHKVTVTHPAFLTLTRSNVAITAGSDTHLDLTLQARPTAAVSGIVTDANSVPVAGAELLLDNDGGLVYNAVADAEGRFSIPSVVNGSYRLEVSKLRFTTLRTNIQVADAATSVPVTLQAQALPPSDVVTTSTGGAVKLDWQRPLALYRRDNGIAKSQNGAMVGNQYYLFGCVWRRPATISAIKWMTTEYQGPHNYMNLWLLDIKPDGTPDSKVLYSALNVPAGGDLVWNTHCMDQPVSCPNGFYVAVSYNGMASIAMSDGSDPDWPFVPGVNYRTQDYRTDVWTCVDASFVKNNYMLRVEGEPIGEPQPQYAYRYGVWRFAAEDADNDPSTWQMITPAEGIADLTFVDSLATLPADGDYKYAVAAIYPEGVLSDFIISPAYHLTRSVVSITIDNLLYLTAPVAGELNLGLTCDEIRIFDVAGRLCLAARKADRIDCSALASGCYLVNVSASGRTTTLRIIKK